MLEPLKQWICDSCSGIIESREDGWVEFLTENAPQNQGFPRSLYYGFIITHDDQTSPLKPLKCEYSRNKGSGSQRIDVFFKEAGYVHLLSFLDLGKYANKKYEGPQVKDIREFVDFMKRLTVPYYEEARQYFDQANKDVEFHERLNVGIYGPEFLKNVIQKFGKD